MKKILKFIFYQKENYFYYSIRLKNKFYKNNKIINKLKMGLTVYHMNNLEIQTNNLNSKEYNNLFNKKYRKI